MTKKTSNLKAGDKVTWEASQGKVRGKIVKKLTKSTKIKQHRVTASDSNPSYLVQSDKTKKLAAHKPKALKKQSS